MGNIIKTIDEIRIHNMVDMGLRFSGMIRLYKKGPKKKLINKILKLEPEISIVDSKENFEKLHESFCRWVKENISPSGENKDGEKISYGQAAKTFDVTLSVLVYYCGWPNKTKSSKLLKWIHAAVDNDMMKYLKKHYKDDIKKWPKSIKQVDRRTYGELQNIVKRFVKEQDPEIKLPVHFEDKYWYLLKEGYGN
jgi:hypothetical protein